VNFNLSTGSKKRKMPEKATEAETELEWTIRCTCGNNVDQGTFMICCDTCETWQHGECMNVTEEANVPALYRCEECKGKTTRTRSRSHGRILPTATSKTGMKTQQPVLRICGREIRRSGYATHKTSCAACREHDEHQALFAQKMSSLTAIVSKLQRDMTMVREQIQTLQAQSQTQLSKIRHEMKKAAKEIDQKSKPPLQDATTELVISGLPYAGKEENLKQIITKIATSKSITLPSTVKYFRAIKKSSNNNHNPEKPPKVILQLHNNALKNEMKKRGQIRMTLTNIDHKCGELTAEQHNLQFFINENLSPEQAKLNYQSRQLKKKLGYKYAWTKDGISLLRKAEDEPVYSIRNVRDLQQIEAREAKAAQDRQ
jgi:hypothetical protein